MTLETRHRLHASDAMPRCIQHTIPCATKRRKKPDALVFDRKRRTSVNPNRVVFYGELDRFRALAHGGDIS